jgi:hypothetical protein
MENAEAEPGQFSFEMSDNLPDSIYNVELTLKIRLPESWNEEFVSLEFGDTLIQAGVRWDPLGHYVLCNSQPAEGLEIRVHEGNLGTNADVHQNDLSEELKLSAYPNPVTSHTQIHLEGLVNQGMQLLLLDMHGRKLRDLDLKGQNSITMVREGLSSGMYILLLAEEGTPRSSLKLLVR